LPQVLSRLDALILANHEKFPHFKEVLINAGYHVQAHFLKDELVEDVRGTLYLLWGAVFVVLLIGAANIANLVLARSSVRLKELATRMAMGAGLGRIARLLFAESLLVSGLAGAIGLGFGSLILRGSIAIGLEDLPRGSEIGIDATVVALVAGLTLLVALFIGAIPVIHAVRADLSTVMREESRSGTASRSMRLARNVLVTAQVAFAFVLLLGAGLLLESFRQVLGIDPGFRQAETVLTGRISLPSVRYEDQASLQAFVDRALQRLRALPAVEQAGLSTTIPFGGSYDDSVILAEGYQMGPGESLISPSQIVVSPGYFQAMGIPLQAGRYFDETDRTGGRLSIIVDKRLAQKFWPNQEAIGKRMFFPDNIEDMVAVTDQTTFFNVVGVVGSVKLRALVDAQESVGTYYFPYQQSGRRSMSLVLKASGDPSALTASVRNVIAELDPELPFYDVFTMQQRMDSSLTTRRALLMLAMVFGSIALFLAAVGIYGVLAYVVTQRTREIGIRMALGSDKSDVFRLVLRQGAVLLGIGCLAGLAGLFSLTRFLEGLLYSVHPLSLPVIGAVGALLALVALAACSIPAYRATRIDPVRALNAL
ncbi:MAG: FtsX-like permease family protein, partial [Acidobacteriota bacterium]